MELHEISVREVFDGYKDKSEDGVVAYGGKLNVRPAYQREFVYKDAQRNAVIETVMKNYPLNVMYWAKNGDDSYEVMDGQQRTLSICSYLDNAFSIRNMAFANQPSDIKDNVLNYKLMVYICEGSESEKLEWFKTINIAGEKLTDQELRNAIFTGAWLSDAKRYFSKTSCAAFQIAKDYVHGSPVRQDFLETALSWISEEEIESYMSAHQHDPNSNELWLYFKRVIDWVEVLFPTKNYRKEMKGVEWGSLYNRHKDDSFDQTTLEKKVAELMVDDDVTKKSGIYPYLITGDESYLNVRTFSDKMKREAYERQKGICPHCSDSTYWKIDEMEADHITPWHLGGKTNAENCQMLCKHHNRKKSGK